MNMKELNIQSLYYTNNIYEFVKEYMGIEFTPYQKLLLQKMENEKINKSFCYNENNRYFSIDLRHITTIMEAIYGKSED